MAAKDLVKCIYFGEKTYAVWYWTDFKVECSNPTGCKGWIRIYANTRNRAVECWNKAMRRDKESSND